MVAAYTNQKWTKHRRRYYVLLAAAYRSEHGAMGLTCARYGEMELSVPAERKVWMSDYC